MPKWRLNRWIVSFISMGATFGAIAGQMPPGVAFKNRGTPVFESLTPSKTEGLLC